MHKNFLLLHSKNFLQYLSKLRPSILKLPCKRTLIYISLYIINNYFSTKQKITKYPKFLCLIKKKKNYAIINYCQSFKKFAFLNLVQHTPKKIFKYFFLIKELNATQQMIIVGPNLKTIVRKLKETSYKYLYNFNVFYSISFHFILRDII